MKFLLGKQLKLLLLMLGKIHNLLMKERNKSLVVCLECKL